MGILGATATKWLILYSVYRTNPSGYEENIRVVPNVEEVKKFLNKNPSYILKGAYEITGKSLSFQRELKETYIG